MTKEEKENIIAICKPFRLGKQRIKIHDDGTVDVTGDVRLNNKGLIELPIKFGVVTGDFTCSHNNHHDDKGKIKNEFLDYTFKTGILPQMRKEAFDKFNDLKKFFEEFASDEQFQSTLAAELKGWLNTKGYSIDVFFYKDEFDHQIEGDVDVKMSHEVEAIEFKKMGFEI